MQPPKIPGRPPQPQLPSMESWNLHVPPSQFKRGPRSGGSWFQITADRTTNPDNAIVLVKGTKPIELSPGNLTPSTAKITWLAYGTETSKDSSLTVHQNGNNATVDIDKTGIYIVGPGYGDNPKGTDFGQLVIVVGISFLKGSTSTAPNFTFKHNHVLPNEQGAETCVVSSGNFFSDSEIAGIPDGTKKAFFLSADVLMNAYSTEAINKVVVSVLQNETKDDTTATYTGGSTEKLSPKDPAHAFPYLDAQTVSEALWLVGKEMSWVSKSDQSSGHPAEQGRTVKACDSPGPAFPTHHFTSTKEKLKTLTGGLRFKTAICAYSKDAQNSYVVLATCEWSLTFNGTYDGWFSNISSFDAGTSTSKIESEIGGVTAKDAGDAGFEVANPTPRDRTRGMDWDPPPP